MAQVTCPLGMASDKGISPTCDPLCKFLQDGDCLLVLALQKYLKSK